MRNIHKVSMGYPPFISSLDLGAMLGVHHEVIGRHIRKMFHPELRAEVILEMTLTDTAGIQYSMYMVPKAESKALVEAIDAAHMDAINFYWSNTQS